MLFAPDHLALDALFGHRQLDSLRNFPDDLTLAAFAAFQRPFKNPVSKRIQIPQSKILKADLQVVDAQPVGDRRIDFQCFAGDARLFSSRHRLHRSHIVQTICQLYEYHANVFDHCQHHLAETLRLRFRLAGELNLVQFADAIDQYGHLGAELLFELA